MKLTTLSLMLVLSLGLPGCSWLDKIVRNNDPIIEYRTIVPAPPAELYTIPPYVKDINVPVSTQKDVSDWIAKNYTRQVELEERILKLQTYQKQLEEQHKPKTKENPKEEVKPKRPPFWK